MKIKFFAGTWDSWGIELSYCRWYRGITIALVHWYFGFEIWTKKEVEIADAVRRKLATEDEEFFEE
jgi:hypothetical protein